MLLFDQNISFRVVKLLDDVFPECIHLSQCGLMNAEDTEIWKYARLNNYTIGTFDSDFFEISLIKGHPPKIIWIRTGNLTTEQIASLLIKHRDTIREFIYGSDFYKNACLKIE